MAGLGVNVGNSATIACGTSRKTLLMVTAPADQALRLKRVEVTFDGTSPTGQKPLVQLVRGVSGGSSYTSRTPQKNANTNLATVRATAQENPSVESTGGTEIRRALPHPQGGVVWSFVGDQGIVAAADNVAVLVTSPAAIGGTANIEWEE